MIKILIPQDKRQGKTTARGFWLNDSHKLFYDYLNLQNYKDTNLQGFHNHLDKLQKFYSQESLFFIDKAGQGNIYYNRDKIEVLKNRIYKEVLRANLRAEIKEALRNYGGITIYKIDNRYFKEIYFNKSEVI